jgi:hypothetical protein
MKHSEWTEIVKAFLGYNRRPNTILEVLQDIPHFNKE